MKFFESDNVIAETVNTVRCMVVCRPESSGSANTVMSKLNGPPFWFYTVSSNKFAGPNVSVVSDTFFQPGEPDFSFDAIEFSKFITKQYDYDIALTFNIGFGSLLANLFFNRTSHKPSIIGFHNKDTVSEFELVSLPYFDVIVVPDEKTKAFLIEESRSLFNESTVDNIREKFILFGDFGRDTIASLLSEQKRISDRSEAIDKIKEKIRAEGSVSKENMIKFLNWGRGIPWTPYRRAILDDKDFADLHDSTPVYTYTGSK